MFVFDDNSTDRTPDIVQSTKQCTYLKSTFRGLDEARDKNYLLRVIMDSVPWVDLNIESNHWVLCIDGDEELEARGVEKIKRMTNPEAVAYSLRILYLWDNPETIRVDRVYGTFKRPSLYRLINPEFTFQTTPWGGNLHCSSIPQEFLGQAEPMDVCLLHYGYMLKEDRLRKFAWYNQVDPDNPQEDCYRHMIQGDVSHLPPDMRLLHAGPMQLMSLTSIPGM